MKPKNRIQFGSKEVAFPKKKSTLKTGGWTEKQKAALMEARTWYDAWREEFISTPCAPTDIPARFVALRDQLIKKVKNRKILAIVLEIVDYDMKMAYAVFSQPRPPSERGG